MMRHSAIAVFALASTIVGSLSTPAAASIAVLSASMNCAQAAAGAGTCEAGGAGIGVASVAYDDETSELTWFVNWEALSGTATDAHFHGPALPDESALPRVDIDFLTNHSVGSAIITSEQATDLLGGLWYVDIHSTTFGSGEIRGQVMLPDPNLPCVPLEELPPFLPPEALEFFRRGCDEPPVQLSAGIDCVQADAGAGTCGAGGMGTGFASILYDEETNLVAWDVSWEDLSSAVIAAHFHGPALREEEALAQVAIDHRTNPSLGSTPITPEQASDLLAGLWYVNIHSDNFPLGEIRGKVLVPEPAGAPLLASALATVAILARRRARQAFVAEVFRTRDGFC